MRRSSALTLAVIVVLLVLELLVWSAVYSEERKGLLTVTFLDVGQGDAIFIDAPSGQQVLIDGGPGSAVLRELSRAMPWYDRSIDVVIATHPDADHISGLVDVLSRYRVGQIFGSGVESDTALAGTFATLVAERGGRVLSRGDILDLGGGARLEILFPDRPVPRIETNVACVVARLVYGTTAFMLPCDSTDDVESYLVRLDGEALASNVLKAAHHGSKTSSAPVFVGAVSPEVAVYSRGCENSYGHPHQETIDTFARFGVPTLDTCEEGSITFVSDGHTVSRK